MSPFSERKPRENVTVAQEVLREVEQTASEGLLSCGLALRLANRLNVAPLIVGEAANRLSVRIVSCQLGCFDSEKPGSRKDGGK